MNYSERFVKESVITQTDKAGLPRKAYLLVRNVSESDGNNPLSAGVP